MHDQIVHHMPSSLEQYFPQLEVLQIWSCGLRSLTKNDIKVFEDLKEVSMSGNEIETLQSDLFAANPKVTKIDFSRNNLKHIGFNLLVPLENLMFVDFYQNFCINDGSRNRIGTLVRNLRRNCKPTMDMLMTDLLQLNEEVRSLKMEVKACERIHGSRRCEDDMERIVGLDTLFPSIYVNDENRIDGF